MKPRNLYRSFTRSQTFSRSRRAGHAETPFIVGFFGLLFGLLWAFAFVTKHKTLALGWKIAAFLFAPIGGTLFIITVFLIISVIVLVGEAIQNRCAQRKNSQPQRGPTRRSGHAQTSCVLALFSAAIGFLPAVIYIENHPGLSEWMKLAIFVGSIYGGMLVLAIICVFLFAMGKLIERIKAHIAARQRPKS